MQTLPPELADLAPYIRTVSPYLDKYGYLAVFFGVMLEDFGVPLPGETLLISAALFASLGDFNILWVGLLAFGGAILGDNIGYVIGRYAGRPAVLRYGRFAFLKEQRLRKLESFFHRQGGKVVIVARFIEGLRQFNGIIAGLGRMSWSLFLLFNTLGAALWVGLWVSAVYFLGSRLGTVLKTFRHFEIYLLGGLALAALGGVAFAVYIMLKRRR